MNYIENAGVPTEVKDLELLQLQLRLDPLKKKQKPIQSNQGN